MPRSLAWPRPLAAPNSDLAHLPGDLGWPLLGSTLRAMRDPVGLARERLASFGEVYKARSVYMTSITLLGPAAAQFVLADKKEVFSSREGWRPNLGLLFPNSLMLQDFELHREHRQIMFDAFRRPALERYAEIMDQRFEAQAQQWCKQGGLLLYAEIKSLLLSLGGDLFLGQDLLAQQDWIGHAMAEMTAASTSLVRLPLPFSSMRYGLKARARLAGLLRRLIPAARAGMSGSSCSPGSAGSVLDRLCAARNPDGLYFTDEQIVDHLLFIIMAAHDTTTSSACSLMLELALHPTWQERIREELATLPEPGAPGADLLTQLQELPLLDAAWRECLRLYPPVPALPRYTLRETEFQGLRLPAGRHVWLFPVFNHRDARWWSEADSFQPERFLRASPEDRQHKFLFIPFGGGAHTCIGLHAAGAMVKLLAARVLTRCRLLPPPQAVERSFFPFPRPDGHAQLPLRPLT